MKVRQTLICGSERMVVFDDLEASEKVKVYDKGIVLGDPDEIGFEPRVGYRTGDMWAPRLDVTEALRVEAEHFVDCINTGTTPQSDGTRRSPDRAHPRGRHHVARPAGSTGRDLTAVRAGAPVAPSVASEPRCAIPGPSPSKSDQSGSVSAGPRIACTLRVIGPQAIRRREETHVLASATETSGSAGPA